MRAGGAQLARRRIHVEVVGNTESLRRQLEKAAKEAAAAEKVLRCSMADVIDIHGAKYDDLTARDILRAGKRGLRGRAALNAALRSRLPLTGPVRVAPRARESAPRPRRSRSTNQQRTPGSDSGGDEPPPEPERVCGHCGASLEGRRPNALYCDGHRQLARYYRKKAAAAAGLTPQKLEEVFTASLNGVLHRLPEGFGATVLLDLEQQGFVVRANDGSYLRTTSADRQLGEFWGEAP